jgi:sterol desaturase/sphingolipid hydroxylase (fatty acid hydroxylase superfamily)
MMLQAGDAPLALATVPPERKGSFLFGITVHLGPAALFILLSQATGRSPAWLLPVFLLASLSALFMILGAEKGSPSVSLDPLSLRDVIAGIGLVFITGAGIGTAVVASGQWFLARIYQTPWHTGGWLVIVSAVPLTDFGYYWIHRTLNHGRGHHAIVRLYRRNHARHHSVAALDFFRGNLSSVPDTAVTGFQFSLIVISSFLGMDLLSTLTAYGLVLLLQATHHVNYTFNIGPFRYLFVDNHSHKLHHCPGGTLVNYGAIVSIWDRLFGTFYEDWTASASYMEKHAIHIRPLHTGVRRQPA